MKADWGYTCLQVKANTWKEKELVNLKMKINGYESGVSTFRMEILTLRAVRFWNNLTITTAREIKTRLHRNGLCDPVIVLAEQQTG